MNYLAHVLLSGADPRWQLGGFLGDFIKGPLPPVLLDERGDSWEQEVLRGIQLHRRLDSVIDSSPDFIRALSLFPSGQRRVAGIVLDVIFDHLLVRHWRFFSDDSLSEFCQQFYQVGLSQRGRLPQSAERFLQVAAQHDLFAGYGNADQVKAVIERISTRLRAPNQLVAAGEHAFAHLNTIEPLFLRAFPQLQRFAVQYQTDGSMP